MEYVVICMVAFLASLLTFFTGFGLGTILTPVFVLFFPVDLSIALTGVVHFFNNIFKLVLVGQKANKQVLIRFGIPAVVAAFIGAWILLMIADLSPLFEYSLGSKTFTITPIKLIISLLLILFALIDLVPVFEQLEIKQNQLPLGGFLSGFFGGLSGHQGALRSAFLIKSGLNKASFIGTSVVIASFIDFTRIAVYASRFLATGLQENLHLVIAATLAAFLGAYVGNKLLKKITLPFIQKTVAIMLVIISLGLGLGFI